MEQNQNQDPFEQFESNTIEALDVFDRDKKELYEYVMAIAENGFDEFDHTVTAALIHNAVRSFSKASTELRKTTHNIDESKKLLAEFWKADDTERVALYRDLTSSEKHQFIEDDELEAMVEELYSDSSTFDELEEKTMQKYKLYLNTDTNILLGKLQAILGKDIEDETEEGDVELYEQGPEVLELVNNLEEIACCESEGFREGYEEGVSLSRKVVEVDGEFVTEYSFSAERAHIINKAGEVETTSEFNVGSKIEYFYHGIESLPVYVRDFLCDLAQDEEAGFSLEDLTDEYNVFTLRFTYNITANADGTLWPYIDLALMLEDVELPIPDVGGLNPQNTSLEEQTVASEEEQRLFDSIFTDSELSEIQAAWSEVSETVPEADYIEAFRCNISSIKFATTKQHIAMARSLADEFKQKKPH